LKALFVKDCEKWRNLKYLIYFTSFSLGYLTFLNLIAFGHGDVIHSLFHSSFMVLPTANIKKVALESLK